MNAKELAVGVNLPPSSVLMLPAYSTTVSTAGPQYMLALDASFTNHWSRKELTGHGQSLSVGARLRSCKLSLTNQNKTQRERNLDASFY